MNSYRNAKELVARLEQKSALTIVKKNRFWWYDLVFLDVLDRRNELGASLFSKMFQKNTPKVIFDFLDDQSTPTQELKIISSFPPLEFIKSAIRLLFKL